MITTNTKNIWKDMFRNTLNTGISINKVSDVFVGQKIKINPRVSQFSLYIHVLH